MTSAILAWVAASIFTGALPSATEPRPSSNPAQEGPLENVTAHLAPVRYRSDGFVFEARRLGATRGRLGAALQKIEVVREDGWTFPAAIDDSAVVQWAPEAEPERALAALGLVGEPLSAGARLWRVRGRSGEDGLELASRLADVPELTLAEPNLHLAHRRAAIEIPPNDPRYPGQWFLERLDIETAWALTTGRPEVSVVVVDNGCDLTHPDLAAKLDPGRDVLDGDDDPSYLPGFPGNEHGTACAGVIAAATDNALGVAGACPECRLRCVRLLDDADHLIPLSADVRAFEFAVEVGAAVVSNSWSFGTPMPAPAALRAAIEHAVDQGRGGLGAVVVFAAGNDNRELGVDELAAVRGVVAVGATNIFDEAAAFSNRGAPVDVVAPAGTVTTDVSGAEGNDPSDYTTNFGGTSSACPIVAGLAGLVVSAQPAARGDAIAAALIETARRAPLARPDATGHDPLYGYGIVQPTAALRRILGLPEPTPDAGVSDAGPAADGGEGLDQGGDEASGCSDIGARRSSSMTSLVLLGVCIAMMIIRTSTRAWVLALIAASACAGPATPGPDTPQPPASGAAPPSSAADAPRPFTAIAGEDTLLDLTQLTFGGENAEAYWSFDGRSLIFQRRDGTMACDRIFEMDVAQGLPSMKPISSGQGVTTCSYFLPGDEEVVYASTHLASPECPPKPDMSQGYVWALYEGYDIIRARRDGSNPVRLTDTPGYDAEATVCAKDGSIVFTSVRDGDIDLYRMDKDGKNVRRLTSTPGYDGGAFFSADCSKIVWRASRPAPGRELEDFRRLLAQGLVRPSKLELFVANADGSDPVQVTYLDAASFGPFFFPDGRRIIFSSNAGDPKGREFDLWMVNVDGTNLRQVTRSPGFDGFPMFSPDGARLIFASNRATAPGANDTNLFVATWVDPPAPREDSAAQRVLNDVTWLAEDAREGRGVGTKGLEASGAYIEQRFQALGLEPAGDEGFRQNFPVTTGISSTAKTSLRVGGAAVAPGDFTPMGFSAQGSVKAPMILAGYGIVDAKLGVDDYRGLNVKGRVVVVRRFVPDTKPFESTENKRRFGDIRYKAWLARERGAKGLLVVDAPISTSTTAQAEAPLPGLFAEGPSDAGLPVLAVKRAALRPLLEVASRAQRPATSLPGAAGTVELTVELFREEATAFNVIGKVTASKRIGGPVIIGAHYDHLGFGGHHSLAPDKRTPHVGADDNASGVAGLLEIARRLGEAKDELQRDVVLIAFSAEESGLIGSSRFVEKPTQGAPLKDALAMLNLDMVGRLRGNTLSALGGESAKEWPALVSAACAAARVTCSATGDGYGPSDHTPFYATGIPVLHFFTGPHGDYHKPSDRAAAVNAVGLAKVSEVVAHLTKDLATRREKLSYLRVPSPAPRGDLRSFNASLGTIPDYAGPPGQKGVLLAGVRPKGAAELAGMRRGDLLVRLGKHEVGSIEDFMFVLNASKPGETVTAVVMREGRPVSVEVTFQESKRAR